MVTRYMKKLASSFQISDFRRYKVLFWRFLLTVRVSRHAAGFTLIETLVAISLLSVAIVTPMSLASQSLGAAYYSRDQITAYHLAQEAIEAVRSIRDGRILEIALTGATLDIFDSTTIPIDVPFRIDVRLDPKEAGAIVRCSDDGETCILLQTDGMLYGYNSGWTTTRFTRIVKVSPVGSSNEEFRVTVTITWQTGAFKIRTFNISENLYRWIDDSTSP